MPNNQYSMLTTKRPQLLEKTLYSQVLLACALSKRDELGSFAAGDVREPMSKIMGKQFEIPSFSRHLHDFCDETRGFILQKSGKKHRLRFRFSNPLMQPFVVMRGLDKGKIAPEILKQYEAT